MGKVFTITEGLENMGAIKSGGQGSVYKGRRTGTIITAVKLLPTPIHSESPHDKNFSDFQNEVQKLKKVNEEPNPNVVKILNYGITETGSLPFIEMEFIEGPDLEELLKPPHPPVFTIKETLKVAEQLSNALAHCHRVNVKHGDIKSNNVKLNRHTGNYVLLDFGLAVMSDEQRRTSLRQAGAIEFMAPEQNEGIMLFQTDVYSFGVILFELLAGQVPFPLEDKGETARNLVRVAHMETAPPDLLALRRQKLPPSWNEEMRQREMRVPNWLVDMIYKCLEKKPEDRFADGRQLHEHILWNSIQTDHRRDDSAGRLVALEQEKEKLQREKEQLQQLLARYQENESSRTSFAGNRQTVFAENVPTQPAPAANGTGRKIITALLTTVILISLLLYGVNRYRNRMNGQNNETSEQTDKPLRLIGQYKVVAPRAYFYDAPGAASHRVAYMIPSNDVVEAYDEKKGFIYTEFTNSKGQTSKGWLRKSDLVSLDEWTQNQKVKEEARPTDQDINSQLQEARSLLSENRTKEALYIYSYLAKQEVPEAMYQYGNLALQNKNEEISCAEAMDLLNGASDKGYAPAKRTLGFLYLFAENPNILKVSHYDRCEYEKNVVKGTRLLMEAVMAGDTTARHLVDEINRKRNEENAAPEPVPTE